jgi:adenylate cyclase
VDCVLADSGPDLRFRAFEWFRPGVTIAYADGRLAKALPGATLLEISRAAGVPHASVCGGRGRCTTCR